MNKSGGNPGLDVEFTVPLRVSQRILTHFNQHRFNWTCRVLVNTPIPKADTRAKQTLFLAPLDGDELQLVAL